MDPFNAENLISQIGMLQIAMGKLDETIGEQGAGVSQTLYRASQLYTETVEKASAASERHAKSLTRATWALVIATLILAAVAGVHAHMSAAGL